MKRYREVEADRFVAVGIVCDRCGHEPAAPASLAAWGTTLVAWGEVTVFVQGNADRHAADLCASCAAELVTWIQAGGGRGLSNAAEMQADIEAAERLVPLEEAIIALGFAHPESQQRIAALVRQRGGR